MKKDQVLKYLSSLSSKELEEIFSEFVEYTNNYILEDRICSLECKIDELEEELYFRNGGYE